MNKSYTRIFSSLRKEDIAEVGGKGANLGELTDAGFPVPPGFVITAQTYKDFFTALGLKNELEQLSKAQGDKLEQYCAPIREAITSTPLPLLPAQAILAAYEQLLEERGAELLCAVRSSATTEDLQDASFAGQHGTYYYVDRVNLLRMIRLCWASLWNAEAVSYRLARGIEHTEAQMAVVVQEMIRADVAGITFTVNPVSGAEEVVTESSWGMGAAIVDGRVTPDRYIFDRNTLQLRERRIACKRFMVSSTLQAGATSRLEEIPQARQQEETLPPELLCLVANWAVRAEEHFASPQDLEWAIADGRFYLLQSRPITAMGGKKRPKDPAGQYVLFKPYAENMTDALTPMMMSLFSRGVHPFICFLEGRAYLDLKFLLPLLPFRLSGQDVAALFYDLRLDSKLTFAHLSWKKLLYYLPGLFVGYLSWGVFLARSRNVPDDFMEHFRDVCKKIESTPNYGPEETLRRLWIISGLLDPLGTYPLMVNVAAASGALLPPLLTALLQRWWPDAPADAIPLLCSGQRGVLSAEMGREIKVLAKEAVRSPAVKNIFLQSAIDEVLTDLSHCPEAEYFLQLFNAFLEKHGHRAVRELELQSPRWEENPAQLITMIRNYLLAETRPGVAGKKQEGQHDVKREVKRAELMTQVREKLALLPLERFFQPRQRFFNVLVTRARYLIKLRENSRFYHIMGLYFVRKKLLSLENEFIAQGSLKCKDDIFFLHLDEVRRMQQGELHWADVEQCLRRRRLEHTRFSRKKLRKTVGIQLPESSCSPGFSRGGNMVLQGQSASPGACEGIARVILDPGVNAELQPGEILVAPYTDPAWTPLFLTAGAAVVEVGSYLSHAGTVAREYGLPCVVDVAECTKRIQSGDRLYVDGDQGIVQILGE
ncbi:MAG: PEP/pyruvate-binding domain-containing protein [Candidatus Electrothrix aestuarii]|uniref:PEP/pyruvate-binding domain-containing protein n=1 Tax=Candidatus Electrothrix aestuarii TaxID=3062594 RepID=A0AAU8M131_9BACT|nr:PEP/pyruvate-binding domain-containing protein [Candidatus Electrothrix aestuarii]